MTRRTTVLFLLVLVAASPLVWMSVDADAGNTLLSLTSGSNTQPALNNQSPLMSPVR